jgi:WD40 repeat protein
MDSEGNLYLSTGREVPASIYSVSGDTLDAIFTDYEDEEPVKGIAYMGGYLYYASYGTEIYRLDLYTGDRREVCTIPGSRLISDVGFRNAKSQISEGCHAVSVDGDL